MRALRRLFRMAVLGGLAWVTFATHDLWREPVVSVVGELQGMLQAYGGGAVAKSSAVPPVVPLPALDKQADIQPDALDRKAAAPGSEGSAAVEPVNNYLNSFGKFPQLLPEFGEDCRFSVFFFKISV